MTEDTAKKVAAKGSATLKMALLLFVLAVICAAIEGARPFGGILFFAAIACAIVGGIQNRSTAR
jgi:membrane-bound ClpP family serine protease